MHPWPENHYFLTTVENQVLLSWVRLLLAQRRRHLSLHCDGVLGTRAADELRDSFSTEAQEQIHVDTGCSVTIVQKHHHTFIDGLKLKGIQEKGRPRRP